ncbi:MAG: hypothetical protein C5S48_07215 [Candidatus Methanogaster sp.]|nr:MAG: hypothetical protein C5S48_07215 [ANME-2 cluster archaeon]
MHKKISSTAKDASEFIPMVARTGRKSPPYQTARCPDRTGATSKTGHPNILSCPLVWVQLKSQSPDGKYYRNRFSQTPKATSYRPEPRIPRTRPHPNTRRQFQTAAGWRPKTPHENAKARPLRCAGVTVRPERFRRRHTKAHPGSGRARSTIRDWDDFVRLGGTSVLYSEPIICGRLTELIAKNP